MLRSCKAAVSKTVFGILQPEKPLIYQYFFMCSMMKPVMEKPCRVCSTDISSKKKPVKSRFFGTLRGRLKYTDPILFLCGCVRNTVLFFCVSKNCVRKNCVNLCTKNRPIARAVCYYISLTETRVANSIILSSVYP